MIRFRFDARGIALVGFALFAAVASIAFDHVAFATCVFPAVWVAMTMRPRCRIGAAPSSR